MSLFGNLTLAGSEFINKRGLYAGRRSTKVHVAVYRKTHGKLGGSLPGWPQPRMGVSDEVCEVWVN
jgi:hypothetical protein